MVSSFNDRSIKKYHADTGEFLGNFATMNYAPTRMIIREDSLLYVLPWGQPGVALPVERYDLQGNLVDEYTNAGIVQAIGMDWDADGNFYVSSYSGGYIRKFDSNGNDLGFFINDRLMGPTNIWFDNNGDLIVLDYSANNIKRFDSTGTLLGVFISGILQPEGIAFLPNGDMLIGDGTANLVKVYDSEGMFIRTLPAESSLITPNAIVIRNKVTSGIKEVIAQETAFVAPNIGTNFTLLSDVIGAIKTLEIYDVSGVLVERKSVADAQIWNANLIAEGIYFLIAEIQKGEKWMQKVVVKR